MTCQSFTESGKPCHFDGCESYRLAQAALTAAQLRYGDLDLETARIRSDRDRLAGVVAGMEEQNARLRDVLKELHTLVWGECPSLLNEDIGGDSRLDMEIEDCIGNALKEVG